MERYTRYFEREDVADTAPPQEAAPQEDLQDPSLKSAAEEKDFPKEKMYQKTLASLYTHIYDGLLEDLLNYQEAALKFMEPEFITVLESTIEQIKTIVEPLENYTKSVSEG
jgi:hypothetical protein